MGYKLPGKWWESLHYNVESKASQPKGKRVVQFVADPTIQAVNEGAVHAYFKVNEDGLGGN
jgi:hypothetical protein